MRKTGLLLASMIVAMTIYGCQSEEPGESRSSETAAQGRAAEETGQARSGDLGEAQGDLGPEVEKIMNSPFYRYGEWRYLKVDPSDGRTVGELGPATRM